MSEPQSREGSIDSDTIAEPAIGMSHFNPVQPHLISKAQGHFGGKTKRPNIDLLSSRFITGLFQGYCPDVFSDQSFLVRTSEFLFSSSYSSKVPSELQEAVLANAPDMDGDLFECLLLSLEGVKKVIVERKMTTTKEVDYYFLVKKERIKNKVKAALRSDDGFGEEVPSESIFLHKASDFIQESILETADC